MPGHINVTSLTMTKTNEFYTVYTLCGPLNTAYGCSAHTVPREVFLGYKLIFANIYHFLCAKIMENLYNINHFWLQLENLCAIQ